MKFGELGMAVQMTCQ